MSDPVNHPSHYTQYKHEVIELTMQLDFLLGNFCKYILRAPFKNNEVEDLRKAAWYLRKYYEEVVRKGKHKQKPADLILLADTFENDFISRAMRLEDAVDTAALLCDLYNNIVDKAATPPNDIDFDSTVAKMFDDIWGTNGLFYTKVTYR